MDRNPGQQVRNPGEAVAVSDPYLDPHEHRMTWRIEMTGERELKAEVEVVAMEDTPVVYLRHVGPYAGDSELFGRLWGQLYRWAGPRGLVGPGTRCFTLYHDNPNVTDEDKLRISLCLSVPEGTAVDGEIGAMVLPGGDVAVARFLLDPVQYGDAWTAVYGGWLPESGYQPDDRPAFEEYHNDPKEHPDGLHDVAICVPVRPL